MSSGGEYETRWIETTDGVGLAVDVFTTASEPSAPGFVLVHGLASNARLYDGVAEALRSAGHAAASVDLRGHGRSDKPQTGYDYDSLCSDLAQVLDALVADPGTAYFTRPVVVGQSFGGNLVLELAHRHPGRLCGVACIDGGTIDLAKRFDTFEAVTGALSPPRLIGTPLEELRARFRSSHQDWSEGAVSASLANFEVRPDGTVAPHLSLEHHLAILRTMWETSPIALYASLEVPVLLLPAATPKAAPQWAKEKERAIRAAVAEIGRAEVHWFSPADHDVHAQHPGKVAAVLLGACDGLFA